MFHSKLTGMVTLGVAFADSYSLAVGERSAARAADNNVVRYLETAAASEGIEVAARKAFLARAQSHRNSISGAVNPGESSGYVRPSGSEGLPKSTVKKHRRPSKRTKADKAALADAEAKRQRHAAR